MTGAPSTSFRGTLLAALLLSGGEALLSCRSPVVNLGSDVDAGSNEADGGSDGGISVCSFGDPLGCNDSPAESAIAGTCNADGTCTCTLPFQINPGTGKCRRAAASDGGVSDAGTSSCTFGKDWTCNADPVSAILRGQCNATGSCSCNLGSTLNPAGLCVAGGSGQACIFGLDSTCNDDPAFSTPQGHCNANNTCTCFPDLQGQAVPPNPATGRCRPRAGACELLLQNCPNPGDACYLDRATGVPGCFPAGTSPEWGPCQVRTDCVKGSSCDAPTNNFFCAIMCNPRVGGTPGCPPTETCVEGNPYFGVCSPMFQCIVGQDQGCNDDPSDSVAHGHCNADGTCGCGPEYSLNPKTGRCRWGVCYPLLQDCPNPADGCYPPSTSPGPQCLPAGAKADGAACTSDSDCLKGSTCFFEGTGLICRKMCDLSGAAPSCPTGKTCLSRWARAGMPGLCSL